MESLEPFLYWSDESQTEFVCSHSVVLKPICGAQKSRHRPCHFTWTHLQVVEHLTSLYFTVSNERQSHVISWKFQGMKPAVCSSAPPSGCLLLCLGLSVLTMLLQNLWMPYDTTPDELTGRSPEEQGKMHTVVFTLQRVCWHAFSCDILSHNDPIEASFLVPGRL